MNAEFGTARTAMMDADDMLPDEIWLRIMSFLPPTSISKMAQVCSCLDRIAQTALLERPHELFLAAVRKNKTRFMESYWLRVEQADRDRAFHEAAVAQRRGAVSSLLELGHISSKGYARALAVLLNNTSACDISANLMGLVKPKDRDQFYWLLTTPGLYMTRPTDGVTYLNCLADAIVATGNKGALRGLLWRVVATKNEQLVEKLMDHVSEPEELSKALIKAAAVGNTELARRLLSAGADPNYRPDEDSLDRFSMSRHSALYEARAHDHGAIVELLIQAGSELGDDEQREIERLAG